MIAQAIVSLLVMGGPWAAPKEGTFALGDGDVVVFYGGTITLERTQKGFQPKYPSFVESFVRAQYPRLRVEFYNRAKEEDRAIPASRRLAKDVLALKPSVAVLCFGMPEARQSAQEPDATKEFAEAMVAMTGRLKEANCRVWLLSPPCVDEDRFAALRRFKTNQRLKPHVDALKKIASEEKVGFIDWYSVSLSLLAGQQERHSKFQISEDGVQPTPMGHSVAAVALLRAWSAKPYDHALVIDFKKRTVSCTAGGATIQEGSAPGELAVSLKGIPMFWPLTSGRASQVDGSWPIEALSRFVVKVKNAPETGMLMQQGHREVPVLPFQLADGLDLSVMEGFREAAPCARLFSCVVSKSNVRTQKWLESTTRRPDEPELQEPFDRFLEVLDLYAEGYQKIIDRIPRTLDATLVLKDIMAEAAGLRPPGTRPASARDRKPGRDRTPANK